MHGERKKETLFVPLECEHHEPADARWAHLQGQLSLCLKSPGKPALKLLSLLSRARPTPRPCLPNSEFCLASVRTQSTKGRWEEAHIDKAMPGLSQYYYGIPWEGFGSQSSALWEHCSSLNSIPQECCGSQNSEPWKHWFPEQCTMECFGS